MRSNSSTVAAAQPCSHADTSFKGPIMEFDPRQQAQELINDLYCQSLKKFRLRLDQMTVERRDATLKELNRIGAENRSQNPDLPRIDLVRSDFIDRQGNQIAESHATKIIVTRERATGFAFDSKSKILVPEVEYEARDVKPRHAVVIDYPDNGKPDESACYLGAKVWAWLTGRSLAFRREHLDFAHYQYLDPSSMVVLPLRNRLAAP